MKKTVSLVLSILMILGMIVIPVAAEKSDAEIMDEALIVHHDFEGDDEATQLSDKGIGGNTNEPIASGAGAFNKNPKEASVSNGIASIAGNASAVVYCHNTGTTTLANRGDDYIKNKTGEFTFYAKFRLEVAEVTTDGDGNVTAPKGNHDILRSNGDSIRIYAKEWDTTNRTANIYVSATDLGEYQVGTISYSYDADQEDLFYRVAWTMKYDNASSWVHQVYLSSDDGKTYTGQESKISTAAATFFAQSATPTSQWLKLGNTNAANSKNITYIDDFRIYNKALTETQLKLISEPIKTEELTRPTVDKNLIIHYDFEGSTKTEQYGDKATATDVKDNINSYTAKSVVKNGICHLADPVTGTMKLDFKNEAQVQNGQDYMGNDTGEFTFYTKFRLNMDKGTELSGRAYNIFRVSAGANKNTALQIYVDSWDTTNHTAKVCAKTSSNTVITIGSISYSTGGVQDDTFYSVAWTMKYTADGWTHTAYLLSDDGTLCSTPVTTTIKDAADFFKLVQVSDGKTPPTITPTAPTRFEFANLNTAFENSTTYLDDFRVYNKALSQAEISNIKTAVDFEAPAATATGAVLHGVQTSVNRDTGNYSVRFVGSVDSLDYANAGFLITAQGGGYQWDMSTAEVYSSLNANTDRGIKEITAASMRGENAYLYALSITDIPVGEEIIFVVSPYTVKDGEKTYGMRHTVVFNERGVYKTSYEALGDHSYHSWVEWQIADKFSETDKEDVALIEKLIARMGEGFAVKDGSSNVLYKGKIVKTDVADYTNKKTDAKDKYNVLVAKNFAERYFGAGQTADINGYVNISALCDGTNYNLYYDAESGLAVVMPATATKFDAAEDAYYIERMLEFYNNTTYLPEPTKPVEQTRQEVVYNSGAQVVDFTNYTYTTYGSPEIFVASDGTWYRAYDVNQVQWVKASNGFGIIAVETVLEKKAKDSDTWETVQILPDVREVSIIEYVNPADTNGNNKNIILMGNCYNRQLVYFGWYNPTTKAYKGDGLDGFNCWGGAATSILIKGTRIYRAYNYGVISADLNCNWSNLLQEKTTVDKVTTINWIVTTDRTNQNTINATTPKGVITAADFKDATGLTPEGTWDTVEGNVVLYNEEIYVVYRINAKPYDGYAALFKVKETTDESGKVTAIALEKATDTGIIEIHGNQSMFDIKQDADGNYISFVSVTTEGGTTFQRNVLYMITSTDLVNWTLAKAPVLVERDMINNKHSEIAHAFQYVSFDFVDADGDGNTDYIVLLVRESYGDSCNYHFANAITQYTYIDYATDIPTTATN